LKELFIIMLKEGQLKYWRDQEWSRVTVGKDGKKKYKPCGKGDAQDNPDRCKPKKKWQSMSSKDIKSDKTKKKEGGKKGKQFVSATKKGKVSGDYLKEQTDYRGSHTAPRAEDDAPLWNLTLNGVYPDDIYKLDVRHAIHIYGDGAYYDNEMYRIISYYRNKPNEKIKIYRGIPKFLSEEKKLVKELTTILKDYKELNLLQYHDSIPEFKKWDDLRSKGLTTKEYNERLKIVKEEIVKVIQDKLKEVKKNIQKFKINHGDWVTPVRKYAVDHASSFDEGYEILSAEVYVRDIFTDGSSWVEWGYDPQPPIQTNIKESTIISERAGLSDELKEVYVGILTQLKPTLKQHIEDLKYGRKFEFVLSFNDYSMIFKFHPSNRLSVNGVFTFSNGNIEITVGYDTSTSNINIIEIYEKIKSSILHELTHKYKFNKGENVVDVVYYDKIEKLKNNSSLVMRKIAYILYAMNKIETSSFTNEAVYGTKEDYGKLMGVYKFIKGYNVQEEFNKLSKESIINGKNINEYYQEIMKTVISNKGNSEIDKILNSQTPEMFFSRLNKFIPKNIDKIINKIKKYKYMVSSNTNTESKLDESKRPKSKGKICPEGIAWAKRTYDKWPSAYASMGASKYCKDKGKFRN